MSAWQGLVKKEFRLGRAWLITGLLLLIPGSMVNYYYSGLSLGMAGFGVFLIGLHFTYMGIYMFSSLNKESDKLHLWLHNPQPARSLLLAKLLNGLFSMLISLTVVSLFTVTIARITIETPPIAWSYIWELGIFGLINLIAVSTYIGIWVVLAWTVFRVLKNIIGGWAWLGFTLFLTLSMAVIELFITTKLYDLLINWGPIKLESLQIVLQLQNEIPNPQSAEPNITIGFYVFYLFITILLFLLSSWLLDNKVEV